LIVLLFFCHLALGILNRILKVIEQNVASFFPIKICENFLYLYFVETGLHNSAHIPKTTDLHFLGFVEISEQPLESDIQVFDLSYHLLEVDSHFFSLHVEVALLVDRLELTHKYLKLDITMIID